MPIKERVATTLMIFATMETYGVSKLAKKILGKYHIIALPWGQANQLAHQ